MNRQQTSIKHSALGWVKKSIDDHLAAINVSLKHYIEQQDEGLLKSVKDDLSLIQGVLIMIEQHGAAMLTEEMVSLCDYIAEQQEEDVQALEVMLRAVLQLPDYLEHIQSGHKDIPIAILPLLNDIRAVKNQDLFSEKLLFLPDLSMHQGDVDSDAIDSRENHASKQFARKLRPVYQLSLLKIIKEENVEENLRRLEKICEALEEKSFSEQIARIWWIIGALIESVSRQQLELGASIKSLLGKVDALFRVILLIGESGLLKRQPVDLIKNFLFYIAQPECDGPKALAIKTAYRLEQFLPSEAVRSRVLDNIAGPNQALMKTVSEAIKVDIESLKSTLEIYVNGDLGDTDQLKEVPKELHVISDTLAMLGLGHQRQVIEKQIEVIKDIVAGNVLSSEDELLSMAGELIQVEDALDLMQKRPVSSDEEDDRSETDISRDYELDTVLTSVVTAALDDIQKTKSAILDFIKDPTRGENIDLCVVLMEESRGALVLLNKPRAVAVVEGLLSYLKDYDVVEFIDADRLDALSQVVVSLEYYLEALGEHRSDADNILDFADVKLQALLQKTDQSTDVSADDNKELVIDDSDSVSPRAEEEISSFAPESEAVKVDANIEIESPVEPEPQQTDESEIDSDVQDDAPIVAAEYSLEPEPEPEPEPEVEAVNEIDVSHADLKEDISETASHTGDGMEGSGAADIESSKGGISVEPVEEELEVLKPGSDPDILEIYLEEAEEESENIALLQKDWLLHPEDQNALKNIRRAFHTIKGSGRLVGAMKIGEFAWDFEQLLNHVIDKTIAPNEHIIEAIGDAAVASLQLVEELKNGKPVTADIAYLRGLARALAVFDADQVRIERSGEKQVVESPHDHIHDDDEPGGEFKRLDESMFVAEPLQETVIISEEDRERIDLSELPSSAVGGDASDDSPAFGVADEGDAGEAAIDVAPVEDYASDFGMEEVWDDAAEDLDLIEGQIVSAELDQDDGVDLSQSEIDESTISDIEESDAEDGLIQKDVSSGTEEEDPEDDFEDLSELVGEAVGAGEQTSDLTNTEETPPDPFVVATGDASAGGQKPAEDRTASPEPAEPTDLSIDPELLTIYQQEVEQHLSIVNSALEIAARSGEFTPGEDIYRGMHTIHGASRTADISSIGELAGLLEKPLKVAMAQKLVLDDSIIALYREGSEAIAELTDELVKTHRLPPIPGDLKERLQALSEDLEEHTVELPEEQEQANSDFIDTLSMMNESAYEADNELLTIFIDEANELLEMSDDTLYRWAELSGDDNSNDAFTVVMELQRYLHTLKGGAKMAELEPIGDLSHELESMFIAVIDHSVEKNENLIDLLKDSFDLLHRQVDEAGAGKPLSDPSVKVEELRNLRRGIVSSQVQEARENEAADSGNGNFVTENQKDDGVGQGADNQAHDVIRVRSDLLDNLVNSAGEVSIYRARMEQQVSGLGSHLGELGQTIMRLKNQLRSLEAETDAQIHYSHQTNTKENEDFDPLELDRYTMIQELSRSLSESVNDLSSLQTMLGEQVKDSETLLLQQSRVNTDLQDGLIKSRMVKFSGLLSRLRRLVRQASQELGKKAELIVEGGDNEVDNKVLDRMVAPLEHIIRNAVAHGIESPVERVKKGKPEVGQIKIDISRDGSDIVIQVTDDGGGINLDKVRQRAVQLGLIAEGQAVADADLVQYILDSGFSTAEQVTQLFGRGVGLDVVDVEIKQLGGTLQIETGDIGTKFIARLPFTLSINQAILVRTGEETYAIPLMNIEGITRLETYKLIEHYQSEKPELDFSGQKFTLQYLSHLVGAGSEFNTTEDAQFKQPVILIRSGDIRVALHVDELLGNREIVVKSLGKQLSQVKGLAGASILADGSVVLILDISGLVRLGSVGEVKVVYNTESASSSDSTHKLPSVKKTVMVVDDSITMRRVASKLLERQNYQVVTAKDGVDAIAQLEDARPDVMLLDIEMPRMDGFELASHMQNEPQYSGIPIIMITSRTGEKHRQRALDIGVAYYMGKPYQEDELLNNIKVALEASK
jgi:chemosensory pili system protein ChpA (sensor histidine kinase/response regulator)